MTLELGIFVDCYSCKRYIFWDKPGNVIVKLSLLGRVLTSVVSSATKTNHFFALKQYATFSRVTSFCFSHCFLSAVFNWWYILINSFGKSTAASTWSTGKRVHSWSSYCCKRCDVIFFVPLIYTNNVILIWV